MNLSTAKLILADDYKKRLGWKPGRVKQFLVYMSAAEIMRRAEAIHRKGNRTLPDEPRPAKAPKKSKDPRKQRPGTNPAPLPPVLPRYEADWKLEG